MNPKVKEFLESCHNTTITINEGMCWETPNTPDVGKKLLAIKFFMAQGSFFYKEIPSHLKSLPDDAWLIFFRKTMYSEEEMLKLIELKVFF